MMINEEVNKNNNVTEENALKYDEKPNTTDLNEENQALGFEDE